MPKAPEPSRRLYPDLCSQAEIADLLNVSTRQVRNLEGASFDGGLPADTSGGEKLYPKRACQEWYIRFKQHEALSRIERDAETDRDKAELRRILADARLVEIKVAKEEGKLIPDEVHVAVVGELSDRLRAVAINVPSTYGLRLEQAGVPARDAQEVLEAIAEDLIRQMREHAGELEHNDDGDAGADD